jgi:serine/threonine-protein kinase
VLAAVLVAAGLGVAWGMGLLGPQGAAVPKVVGMTQADAEAAIVQAGFVVGEVKPEPSAEVEAGSVVDQSPIAGAEAELESAVNLTVSTGPLQVDVPNVVGLSEAEAVKILGDAGFRAQSLPDEPDSKAPVGEVIRQSPEGGQKADDGSIVEYVVSRGPQTAAIPDVVGQTQSSAEAELKDAKFKSKAVSQFSDSVKKGVVISQNPSKGFVGTEGSTVTIYVSKGPENVEVPAVIGKPELDAVDAIEAAGLKVAKNYGLQTNSGNVYDQSPAAGEKVPPGSTVTITIDAEPQ